MRVVLDTNVIVSGLLWKGLPGTIFELIDRQKITICLTPNILWEVDKVLRYPKLRQKLESVDLTPEEVTGYLMQVAETHPDLHIRHKLLDRSDEIILAAALTAKVDFLITGNKKHFRSVEPELLRVKIVTPREFLAEIGVK